MTPQAKNLEDAQKNVRQTRAQLDKLIDQARAEVAEPIGRKHVRSAHIHFPLEFGGGARIRV